MKDEEKFEKIFPNEKGFVEYEEKLELLLVLEKKWEQQIKKVKKSFESQKKVKRRKKRKKFTRRLSYSTTRTVRLN